jgi:hypothetical protein
MAILYNTLLHTDTHTHYCPKSSLQFLCSVAASNIGRSSSSILTNCPRPQLPASHSISSQRLNFSSLLTNSVTHLPDLFITSTRLLLSCQNYNIAARIAQKTPSRRYCIQFLPWKHAFFAKLLLSNGSLCWLHSSFLEQICHSSISIT